MIKKSIYIREFSNISKLQDKKIVEYFICEETIKCKKIYGICISETCENEKSEDVVSCVSSDYFKTFDIVKFLYENSVGILGFRDILGDVLCKMKEEN